MIKINDVALIYVDQKPGFYARINDINPDEKPGWWHVQLLALTFPLQTFNWLLDEYQLDGAAFTMGGTPLRITELEPLLEEERRKKVELEAEETRKKNALKDSVGLKVVSLADHRKK